MGIPKKKDEWLLLLIILAGTVLRFYNFSELPLTYDEFSALSRTRFDNFRDLIHYGVVTTDTHPAGVQVFMYYWVKLFGDGSMVVKLPFMIAGVVSIYFTYLIAKQWFNSTTGLVAAMFMAFFQYPIYLTQMARPYASGILLSVLMVWFWSNAFLYCKNKCAGRLIGFVITMALCAYNHYFTLFFAGVVGLSGFFVIKRDRLVTYILSLVAAIVLFLPHIRIFFVQLGKGGIGSWLAKPGPGFFLQYLEFILHFHPLMYVVAALLFLFSLTSLRQIKFKQNKYRWLLLSWIMVTYATAYFYSVYVNAVLQYSVLFFTYPFLVMLVFSFFRDTGFRMKVLMILLVGVSAVYTLIYGREHYTIFYESATKEFLLSAEKKMETLGKNNTTVLTDYRPSIIGYYFDKMEMDSSDYHPIDDFETPLSFKQFLEKQTTDYLVIGWYNQKDIHLLSMAMAYYPYMLEEKNWFLGDYYLLSKTCKDPKPCEPADEVVYHYENTPDTTIQIGKEQLYYNLFSAKVGEIAADNHNNLFHSITATLPQLNRDVMMVTEFRAGDAIINWRAVSFLDFIDSSNVPTGVYEGVTLIDLQLDWEIAEVKIYLWNKNQVEFEIGTFELKVRDGNPVLYSLYYDFSR